MKNPYIKIFWFCLINVIVSLIVCCFLCVDEFWILGCTYILMSTLAVAVSLVTCVFDNDIIKFDMYKNRELAEYRDEIEEQFRLRKKMLKELQDE